MTWTVQCGGELAEMFQRKSTDDDDEWHDHEACHLVVYCLNCIWRDQNAYVNIPWLKGTWFFGRWNMRQRATSSEPKIWVWKQLQTRIFNDNGFQIESDIIV